ncbi:MAG: hypothetical protein HYX64_07930 [Gammaproteobacteria bacterium]|nr:hypothetical protein [Gammaproteobacteria bacterium]
MVAYLAPFRIIDGAESQPWTVTIDDVNHSTWDYVALHGLVGGLDVGLQSPYHMVVSRDGAIALPILPEFRNLERAVQFINHCLAALLLGGVYCESIDCDALDFGKILDWRYLRVGTAAPARSNQFHRMIRILQAPPVEAIHLMSPRTAKMADLEAAMRSGRALLSEVPEVSPEFLLRGTTGFTRRDWGAALSNLWIVIEQITSHLWEVNVISGIRNSKAIPGRIDQLSDTRTWTIAARQELLCQIGVIDSSVLATLAVARKARNALAHTGKHPNEAESSAAFNSAIALLRCALPFKEIPLLALNLADQTLSDPFLPRKDIPLQPTHWMPIPKLPGEEEIEKLMASLRHNEP